MPSNIHQSHALFRRSLARAVILPPLAMVLLVAVFLGQLLHLLSITEGVDRTDTVMARAGYIRRLIVNMEAGLRGYLLNGDRDSLKPYTSSGAEIEAELAALGREVADKPAQLRRVDSVRSKYIEWRRYARQMIRGRDIGGDYQGPTAIARGKVMMDAMHHGVTDFIRSVRDHRADRFRQARQATHFVIVASIGSALLLGGIIALTARRQLIALSQAYGAGLTAAEESYNATIEGWARALDLRDKETEGHSRRVTEMTVRLARVMGLDEPRIEHVRRGALLHDIGKMGIPDSILLKPGPLTDDERAVMQRHPNYAHEWLASIAFLEPALEIPLCHHERWDGTGYPEGLRGTEIPLAARIFAAVDIWDALNNDRPYRKAWAEAKVITHLRSLAGTHLDPDVVDAFLQILTAPELARPLPMYEPIAAAGTPHEAAISYRTALAVLASGTELACRAS